MKDAPTLRDVRRRAVYRLRVSTGLKLGQLVCTPIGFEARIVGFGSDGRVHLRYCHGADLVVLKPELLTELVEISAQPEPQGRKRA